ncbi:TPT-domain-containing protein [Ascodesmis nigricans]|uniref:TPT-domain-containing protein n=1 Tax=Ascodesmis nigricans TaxID=341454 RepID=A0A4S2MYC2_9PEZI|nr:TPT-domain-containing protein [Ascodesmis nigricans]
MGMAKHNSHSSSSDDNLSIPSSTPLSSPTGSRSHSMSSSFPPNEAEPKSYAPSPSPSFLSLSLPNWVYVAFWIATSSAVILFNKWILYDQKFPIFLTTWHMLFATIATQLLARFTSILEERHNVRLSGYMYSRAILPIGVCFSLGLVLNNRAYLFLSVSFIQMLKATTPVVVLLLSWLLGIKSINMKTMTNIYIIVFGVIVASYGEVAFEWNGFIAQVAGIGFEATRLALIDKLLNKPDQKMDPLVSLYYFAPICTVCNVLMYLIFEAGKMTGQDLARIGFWTLMLNGGAAFALNMAVLFVIGKTSSVTYTLCGVLKDILLVSCSVIFMSSTVTALQFLGYGIALVGLVIHKTGTDTWKESAARGFDTYQRYSQTRPAATKASILGGGVMLLFFSLLAISANRPLDAAHAPLPVQQYNGTHPYNTPKSRPYLDNDYVSRRKFDIVVSMFDDKPENVRDQVKRFRTAPTVKGLNPTVTVYVKDGRQDLERIKQIVGARMVKMVPNQGRESDTYLYHILNEYDDLAEHTLFIQGQTHFLDGAVNRLTDYFTPDTGILSLGFTHSVCRCHECRDPWENDIWFRIPEIYSAVYGELCPSEGILMTYTGQFVVSARRIRGGPKHVYEHLLSLLDSPMEHWIHQDPKGQKFSDATDNPFFGHTLERAWMIMFQCADPRIATSCGGLTQRKNPEDSIDKCQCLDPKRPLTPVIEGSLRETQAS